MAERVERQSGPLGAHVYGLNLAARLGDGLGDFVKSLLAEYGVVCFRDQEITSEQQLAFGRLLGNLYAPANIRGLDGYPEIVEMRGTHPISETWHSDSSYMKEPPLYSILVARVVPDFGNDTAFANVQLAYDRLSESMKSIINGLRAVHTSGRNREKPNANIINAAAATREIVHPVVRRHPDTKRAAIYVNPQFTLRFEDMSEEESLPILRHLYAHCTRLEFTWRHKWRPGDVLIWDNAAVQHAVIADVPEQTLRIMHRITVREVAPV